MVPSLVLQEPSEYLYRVYSVPRWLQRVLVVPVFSGWLLGLVLVRNWEATKPTVPLEVLIRDQPM